MARDRQIRVAPKVPNHEGPKNKNQNLWNREGQIRVAPKVQNRNCPKNQKIRTLGPRAPNQSGPQSAKPEVLKKNIRMYGPRGPNQSGPESGKLERPEKQKKSECMVREHQIRVAPKVPNQVSTLQIRMHGPRWPNQSAPENAKPRKHPQNKRSKCMARQPQIRVAPKAQN